jgi:hypothetical protein
LARKLVGAVRAFGVVVFLLVVSAASAQEVAPLEQTQSPMPLAQSPNQGRTVLPNRHGYAFDQPDIVLRQRLFGLAHGLRLLGRVCLLESEFSYPAEIAYTRWHQQQASALDRIERDLERWYYGSVIEVGEAQMDAQFRQRDLQRLMALPRELPTLSASERRDACASFPEAVAQARYDFVRLLDGDAAVADAPTSDDSVVVDSLVDSPVTVAPALVSPTIPEQP